MYLHPKFDIIIMNLYDDFPKQKKSKVPYLVLPLFTIYKEKRLGFACLT